MVIGEKIHLIVWDYVFEMYEPMPSQLFAPVHDNMLHYLGPLPSQNNVERHGHGLTTTAPTTLFIVRGRPM